MTATHDVALPIGATTPFDWDGATRTIKGDAITVCEATSAGEPILVAPYATQRTDGTIVDTKNDQPLVFIDVVHDDFAHEALTVPAHAARALAAALIASADVLDGWVRR